MAKYNEGDILEILEDFAQLGAVYKSGDKYKVAAVTSAGYNLQPLQAGLSWGAYPKEFDRLETIRKVEFKVGDKVRLLETAHGSPGYSCDSPEKVKERLASAGLDYQTVFEVNQKVDIDGDLYVSHAESRVGLYLLPEFLVPWVEEEPIRMELGKTYQSTGNDLFYTPTEFDFEAGRVMFGYNSVPGSFVSKSTRTFYGIEEEFGVLPPVKPENEYTTVTADEFRKGVQEAKAEVEQEDVGGWDREEFALDAPKPETVSVDALREAYEYVDHEYLDIEKLLKLAKRLS